MIGDGLVPQRPCTGTRRHAHTPRAAPSALEAGQVHCNTHNQPACTTCKRLRKPVSACCALGHHTSGHVSRRPQSQLCEAHQLPRYPCCTLKQRGVRQCCATDHHRACIPVLAHRKCTLPSHSHAPHKKPCLSKPAQPPTEITTLSTPSSSPNRRRPKSPPPPSSPAPVPQGLHEMDVEDMVPR